ncbi:hypothetical protein AN931_27870 [Mycobacterium intracellulare subsp. chimaera]|nr:hypothetical protein AN931_27870 [Mycobacterium intracellulare subsp. chimaera]KPN46566.1 hypothetical protein AN933_25820 [Mycobacterium intracellulare subsp. chimaera]
MYVLSNAGATALAHLAGSIDASEESDVNTSRGFICTWWSMSLTCSADANRLDSTAASSAGAAGEVPAADDVGAGLLEAETRVDEGAAEVDAVFESWLPRATSVITSAVTTAAAAPATHHGQRRRRGKGGYPPGGMPTAPAG